jgi:hypothetical protein
MTRRHVEHGLGASPNRIWTLRKREWLLSVSRILIVATVVACGYHAPSDVVYPQRTTAGASGSVATLAPVPKASGGARGDVADDAGTHATSTLAKSTSVESLELDAGEGAPSTTTNSALLPWLVGRWKGENKIGWPITWSEPDPIQALYRLRREGVRVRCDLELTFTRSVGRLKGLLEAVSEDGRRHMVARIVVAQSKVGCTLIWTEGGVRYGLSPERSHQADSCSESDVAAFSIKWGPESRQPYPIGIEFRLLENKLRLRRVPGPQHGATVDEMYTFERQ